MKRTTKKYLSSSKDNVIQSSISKNLYTRKHHTVLGGKLGVSMKKMNCSPATRKSRINKSCFTPDVLKTIKKEYNKNHEDKITATDPSEIWIELKNRLDCTKEDCWLDEIKDTTLRKRIDRYIFAPDKPPEWEKNPNEWLSNFDIMNVLEQYEISHKEFDFIGPSPIDFDLVLEGNRCVWDELCHFSIQKQLEKGKTKTGIIFNLDKHDESGSHWVSLFIDTDKQIIFYFDSAGFSIPEEIQKLVDRIQSEVVTLGKKYKFIENAPNVHQRGNSECGVYSLFFIITMLTGEIERNKILSIDERIKLFKKKKLSDEYIEKYRNIYFNG